MYAGAIATKACIAFLTLVWIGLCIPGLTAQTPRPDTAPEPITGSIAGRVLNESGQGIPNAIVYTRATNLGSQRLTATDSEGNFKFDDLDSALYGFNVTAPSYLMPPRDPEADPVYYRLHDSVTLNLIKGGVITGTVLSASGEPMVQVGVRAVLVRDGNGQPSRFSGFQTQRATDDRGIYRIYGLLPGTYVVFAGGQNSFSGNNAHDEEAPTYAPSSTRDTAALILVSSGDEATGVDIKYRGEPGHAISGTLLGMSEARLTSPVNILLAQVVNGASMTVAVSFAQPGRNAFSFYGLADGEYELRAQSYSLAGESTMSESRHLLVKGVDVSGIELNVKPLGSISGHVILAKSDVAECKDKRQPLFSETLISAHRSEKEKSEQSPFITFPSSPGVPNQIGDFRIRNLAPGQYNFQARYFAKYWYVKSIVQQSGATVLIGAKSEAASKDLARNGVAVRFGENVSRVTVSLAEGAASVRGSIKRQTGQNVPPKFFVYLLPAEKESAEDVLRFFANEVGADGAFALNNLPPGRYWVLGQVTPNSETQSEFKLRSPAEAETRARLRRAAEAGKLLLEFTPCQNEVDYQLPVPPQPSQKN